MTLGPAAASRHLLPLVDQAIAFHARGELAEAQRICLEVLELAPGQGGALAVLYQIRKAEGVLPAAEALVRRLVAIDPNNVWATQELALLLFGKGDHFDAEFHARNAVRIAPTDAQSHNLMGMIMTEANRPQIGEFHYRRALELLGHRQPILLANLAWNLKNQGKMTESRALYEESAELAPDVLQTLLGWARMEETDRDFVRADAILDQADALFPGHPSILLHRAVIRGRAKDYASALALLDQLEQLNQGMGLGTNELLEKGRLLDKIGRYDEAFSAFTEGKRKNVEMSGTVYMSDHAAQLAQRLKAYFTANRLRIVPRAKPIESGPRPIFILGFPRSGTTMVEQTLSAHPKISAGDELTFIHDIANLMPRMLNSPLAYPEALADLWMGDQYEGLDNLRDHYLQRVKQLGIIETGSTRFTDKMPLNETHMGLIALMFPQAPLIHVLRHPLDIVLSVYSNHLTHGFYCANALETIAQHYLLVMDLVDHYRREMTLKYMAVRYEDIVDDQEAHVRRILSFIDLPFDKRCLKFHENKRYARTASYAQVTEKLYDGSRYRYRHYLEHLRPVIPVLAPTIHRLGYSIDD
ncbi:tetratricopeptide repeat-containing sulfotransferase family protein [Rhizobium sp. FY34]|uniref:tetratricopeptide repeat-containing sulfotransferase family protein n=1 Tax=Rhizobium sp. FY34 TaxID=2562309 RepID=UPI001FEF30CF|nr:tetratricopeptide repeat-containing sulfotransferase family protein [Rhizobium sp. FY34]